MNMTLSDVEFETRTIGPLVLTTPCLHRLGLREIINRLCPVAEQADFDHGLVAELVVQCRLTAPRALYDMPGWAAMYDIATLYSDVDDAKQLNDDRVGRLLDAVDVIAIDAPIVPAGTPEHLSRKCEHIFSRGKFQRRCKPGMSHVRGTGRQLRTEGRRAADQITGSATRIVEAFPNTFLGVILPEEAFPSPPGRFRKFNWLYEQWMERGLFRQIVAAAHLPPEVTVRCEREPNRDVRAALICLITAAFVAADIAS